MNVMTVVGTRPEIIRLSRVIAKLDFYCNHILVHTGQNYDFELNQIFFNDLRIRKPDYFLSSASETSSKTIANVIAGTDKLLSEINVDAVLVLGDTNSCMALLPAKKRKIPTFHMEAGNRCFDSRVPEELNRKIIDHIADINMPYSEIARQYLINEGISPDLIIKTGSPMREVLEYYSNDINKSKILNKLDLNPQNYILFNSHRDETIENPSQFIKLLDILNFLSKNFKYQIIFPAHPRTLRRLTESKTVLDNCIKLIKPIGYFDYIYMQKNAKIVLSDSGTISEESSILGFKALNIRESHERPETMADDPVIMTGLSIDNIKNSIHILETTNTRSEVQDYKSTNVSDKVIKIIHSYAGYIKRVIWREY